jgi:uncharacterized peroxidase-related enzyme
MPHIKLPEGMPGIRGLMAFRPETARPLNQLADVLLQAPGPLTNAERELIATYVSYLNDCHYCQSMHGAVSAAHLGGDETVVAQVKTDFAGAPISAKLKALLTIAGQVQKSGRSVTPEAVEAAKNRGATDVEIHDTVLIAAAFCMFNRYVDGLGTQAPRDPELYRARGAQLATMGYGKAGELPAKKGG